MTTPNTTTAIGADVLVDGANTNNLGVNVRVAGASDFNTGMFVTGAGGDNSTGLQGSAFGGALENEVWLEQHQGIAHYPTSESTGEHFKVQLQIQVETLLHYQIIQQL